MPKVSVVLPTFERWPLLVRALSSVFEQTEGDLEVLVIDDCSRDDTPVRLAAVTDPRLRVLRQDPNQGVAAARNRAIEEARGEWVAFLDDDDFWAPTRLSEHLGAIAAAGAPWGYGAALSVGADGARRVMMPAPPEALQDGLLELNMVGPPSTVTVRRDLLHEVGCFDDELSVIADWDLYVRLSRRAPAALCETPLVAYWEHVAAMHHQHRPEMSAELEYLADKHRDLMPDGQRFGARAATRKAAGDDRLAGRRMRAAGAYLRMGVSERSPIDVLRGVALIGGEPVVSRLKSAAHPEVPVPPWLVDVIGEPAEPPADWDGDGRMPGSLQATP
jgi:glycosyltransferase involved in cell wall biosynthesis